MKVVVNDVIGYYA